MNDRVEFSGWVTGPKIFDHVPGSAGMIAAVIGYAASVEADWVGVLASLTRAELDTAMALWNRLRGFQAQTGAVLDVARLKLEADEIELVKLLIKGLRPHRKTRDRFAHGIWARALGLDDQIILLTGRTLAAFAARIHGPGGDLFDMTMSVEPEDVYDVETFQRAFDEAVGAKAAMSQLTGYLLFRDRLGAIERTAWLKRATSEIHVIFSGRETGSVAI